MSVALSVVDGEILDAAQYHADLISREWRKSVEGILGTGLRLIAAKAELPHGEFLRVFADHDNPVAQPVPFGRQAAHRLASVARNELLANVAYRTHLPPSWRTLYELTRLEDLPQRFEAGEITPELKQKDVARWVAEQRHIQRKGQFHAAASVAGERWEVREGDFREVLADLEPASVDAVLTDPPYPDEDLPLWSALGEFASRVLKPAGVLIAWSGQMRLPAILPMLSEHLTYGWTLALELPGSQKKFVGANMFQTWKPVLLYTKDKWPPHDWGEDRFVSPARDKRDYEWQQNAAPAQVALDRFVAERGLVVDPFAGVGSFGAAALATGRRFLGAELDSERVQLARGRCESVHA